MGSETQTAERVREQMAPGPKGLKSLLRILKNPLRGEIELAKEFGPVVRLKLGPRVVHLVTTPEYIKHVLVDNASNYTKGRTFEKTRGYLGNGLATSAGTFWRRQRRIMQPHFKKKTIETVGHHMTGTIGAMCERWEQRAARGEVFDCWPDMMEMALNVTTRALFGTRLGDDVDDIVHAFQVALEHTVKRVLSPVEVPNWLPTVRNVRFRRAIATLDRVTYQLIEELSGKEPEPNLLSVLLHARDDESGEGMSPEQLRDEVLTLMLGGHETTGNGLAWTWYLLSRNPDVMAKVRAEVDALSADPTMADLPNLAYTSRVFQESLRLYPQNWIMSRDTVEADEIGGYTIPPETSVFLGVYVVHHDGAIWDDPERFDPDRFAEGSGTSRHPFAYVPFGGGQRKCIGAHFATMEATLALATLARKFRVQVPEGHVVEPAPSFALRPKGGVPVFIEKV